MTSTTFNKFVIDSGEEWTFEKLADVEAKFHEINNRKYQLKIVSNRFEVISSEQMLDAYSRHGMPIGYDHWQYGRTFIAQSDAYKGGQMGLAYEIVLNSKPAINYLMEQNSLGIQAMVMCHAGFGHNAFFTNNSLFNEWTDPEGIIDYLAFAKRYIKECEEKYGHKEVEAILDAAHALERFGVDRYKRPTKLSAKEEVARQEERDRYIQSQLNELFSSIPKKAAKTKEAIDKFPKEPQENILYFLEKHAPRLQSWQREILRIVRKISQYFVPQYQTKVMNEGFASYIHYNMMHDLYEEGYMTEGAWHEFIELHTGVLNQRDYTMALNPYVLGFNIYMDIERVSNNPTEEDCEWFHGHTWVGNGKALDNIKFAVENFKDESFILQYLSPKVIRDMKLFSLLNEENKDYLLVDNIHNEQGYKRIRSILSKQYDISNIFPEIEIYEVDIWDDRTMRLQHKMRNKRALQPEQAGETIVYIAYLWGYKVILQSVDMDLEKPAVVTEWETDDEPETPDLDYNLSDL